MTLNELRVRCIRKIEQSDEGHITAMNFESLKNDSNYASYALNVDDAINESIDYLIANDKIPYKSLTISVGPSHSLNVISKSSYPELQNAREIRKCHFFEERGNSYAVEFTAFDGKIFLSLPVKGGSLYIFYQPIMPDFDSNSDGDKDLAEYGIDEAMALFIMNYAKANLYEKEEPDIAMSYRTLSMQYANLIRHDVSLPTQRRVRRVIDL